MADIFSCRWSGGVGVFLCVCVFGEFENVCVCVCVLKGTSTKHWLVGKIESSCVLLSQ